MSAAPAGAPTAIRIGIDLGGTKIAGIALGADGSVRAEARCDTPRDDYQATLLAIADMVAGLEKDCATSGASVGLGIPGSIAPAGGLVQNANSTWLNGRPLRDDLTRLLRRLVQVANDADCFILSEAADGAAARARSAFGVILGTGCGGGLVVRRRLHKGPRAIAGEWGHNPLPWAEADEIPGERCWCGRYGCMETRVSGPALERDYAAASGTARSAAEIAARQAGDEHARAALDRHAGRLARGLAAVVNIVDPDVIVLGGGLSAMPHLYARLPDLMAPYIFCADPRVDIRPPRHGPASGARGAARLWDMT